MGASNVAQVDLDAAGSGIVKSTVSASIWALMSPQLETSLEEIPIKTQNCEDMCRHNQTAI